MKKQMGAIKKGYDALAEEYHAARTVKKRGSYFYNELIEMPATFALLGSVNGKRILDLGCGTGIYAKKLLKKGAHVFCVDQSTPMLRIAQKYVKKAQFKKGTAYSIPYPKNHFDIVLAALVIDHVPSLNRIFKEVKRVLKPNGYFVFSAPNPLIESRVRVRIGRYEYKILGYRRDGKRIFGDYFKEGWQTGTKWEKGLRMYHYHRTFETILNSIIKSGFSLVAYKDAKFAKKRLQNKEGKRVQRIFSRIPLFYSIKLQKSA